MSDSLGNGVSEPSPAVDFVSGVIAGAAGLIVGQPFDVVKVRYQTPEYAGRYSSTFRALGSIVKEEKVAGLFKGVTSPMAGIAFINGVVFTSYSIFMRMQLPRRQSANGDDKEPSLAQICLAGAGSGIVGSLLTCPTELVKIRQQSAPPHLSPSVMDVFRHILRTDGLRGLYRGFSATAIRDVAYGPYFCTYEAMCRLFKSLKPPPPPSPSQRHRHHDSLIEEAEAELSSGLTWAELMAAGGVAGVTAWLVTFPFDVFKTRMQAESWTDSDGTRRRPNLRQVIRTTIAKEGWKTCFAGLGPTLIRAMPVNMITFLTFEACVASLSSP